MSGKQRLKSKYDYEMRLYLVSIKYPPSKLSNTKNFPRQIVFPPLGRKWLYLHICIQFSQIARVLQRYQIMYLILTRALQNQWSVIHIVFPCVLWRGKFSNFTSSFANDYQLGKKIDSLTGFDDIIAILCLL